MIYTVDLKKGNMKSELFSDVDMNEVFMSRLFHFHSHILSGLFLGSFKQKEIQDAILAVVFDGLEPAFRSLRELRPKWDDKIIAKKEKMQLIENVFLYLTVSFKDRFQEVARMMGYDIGFIFKKDVDFEKGCKIFLEKHPKIDKNFIQTIKDDRGGWQEIMINIRNNVIEHKAGKNPVYISKLESHLTLNNVEIIFDNCWRAIEDFLCIFAVDMTQHKLGMGIVELDEYKNDKNYEHRFGWYIIK